jgi:TonB family protein
VARRFSLEHGAAARLPWAALISFAVHAAVVLPVALPDRDRASSQDPIDQLVVFLLPPADEPARESQHRGIDWSAVSGNGGAVDEVPDPTPHPVAPVTKGQLGDTAVQTEPTGEPAQAEVALSEIEVDSVVQRDPNSAAPIYPPEMLENSIEGSTFVHYVVDTTGRVDTTTIRVIRSTNLAFSLSVREALKSMLFHPAIHASRRVRQWVEQSFAFRILKAAPRATPDTT